jgi:hypothetical protein
LDLVLDCEDPGRLAGFWREALNYREYFLSADLAVLVPDEGSASPLLLQRVPEPKVGKNRMHLDVVVEDVEAEVRRLQALGASRIDEIAQSFGGVDWVRMADPEHNEFCVCTGVEWPS